MPETENPACMGCPHPASSHRGSTCIECGDAKPLGIADVFRARPVAPYPGDHWYWCRRHEKAERSTEPVNADPSRQHSWCIRIGPFMTEREANRLRVGEEGDEVLAEYRPLGMEIET